ncbi:MAG: YchJ family protein [Gammaproteobacteria bacterium]|nr:YchJ family protein [Gammaproteobacteria bacterium]
MKSCPCGSLKEYAICCGRFIEAGQMPKTPVELMRSRYTAYAKANIDYIQQTMQGPAALGFDINEAAALAKSTLWQKLKILNFSTTHDKGMVEFMAFYTVDNRNYILHEESHFVQQNGLWYYVDGKLLLNDKLTTARNDNCVCGSGKKFKNCCASF